MSEPAGRPLNLVIVGHVDHGKSTLIGRLLHDTGSLPDGKIDELVASSERRGVPIEWSFVLDALQAERDQAITIDTTRIWFRHGERRYAIIDAPGHRQFVKNMLSGAAEADAAILMVDVIEGVSEQTRRHAYLLQLLGISQVIVAINKMDLAGYDRAAFDRVAADAAAYLAGLGLSAAHTIPISAREGINLATNGGLAPWYDGPAILAALAQFEPLAAREAAPLRLRVQDVYRRETQRIIVGRVDSGSLQPGDQVIISPARVSARIKTIERWPATDGRAARAGDAVGFTLDQPVFVERGDVISGPQDVPHSCRSFRALFFWLSEEAPRAGEALVLQWGPTEARVAIDAIGSMVDTRTLAALASGESPQYSVVDLSLRSDALVALDTRAANAHGARCVLLRNDEVLAAGTLTEVSAGPRATNLHPHRHLVSGAERAERNGHAGAVIWMTGLSGSGKSTLALALERRLFDRGNLVYVLDGDNIRSGLNSDLGFTAEDRSENIRRVGEAAALFADAGAIVITAFIAPFADDRAMARRAAPDLFHEVYVNAGLATCEARDPKGLYKKARAGGIAEFTGISSPYEPPQAPQLEIDTEGEPLELCVEKLLDYVARVTAIKGLQRV